MRDITPEMIDEMYALGQLAKSKLVRVDPDVTRDRLVAALGLLVMRLADSMQAACEHTSWEDAAPRALTKKGNLDISNTLAQCLIDILALAEQLGLNVPGALPIAWREFVLRARITRHNP